LTRRLLDHGREELEGFDKGLDFDKGKRVAVLAQKVNLLLACELGEERHCCRPASEHALCQEWTNLWSEALRALSKNVNSGKK